ncbi:MAG: hypothetical protein ABFD12_14670 [Syntrophorhabdus sp.]
MAFVTGTAYVKYPRNRSGSYYGISLTKHDLGQLSTNKQIAILGEDDQEYGFTEVRQGTPPLSRGLGVWFNKFKPAHKDKIIVEILSKESIKLYLNIFPEVEIADINSNRNDWEDKVEALLLNPRESVYHLLNKCIDGDSIKERAASLKYVLLLNQLRFMEIREYYSINISGECPESSETISETIDENPFDPDEPLCGNNESDSIDDMLDEGMDGDLPEEMMPEEIEDHLPNEEASEVHDSAGVLGGFFPPICSGEPSSLPNSSPNGPIRVVTIVDCFGIYTNSLASFIRSLPKRLINDFLRWKPMILSDPKLDGPAVLLSPELIQTIGPRIRKVGSAFVIKELGKHANSDDLFLKMILMHEIGHHFFPANFQAHGRYVLGESLAQWFSYALLLPGEREVMHCFSNFLDEAYRTYEGFLVFLYPDRLPVQYPDRNIPWPIPGARQLFRQIQRSAFEYNPSVRIDIHISDLFDKYSVHLDQLIKKLKFYGLSPRHIFRLHPCHYFAIRLFAHFAEEDANFKIIRRAFLNSLYSIGKVPYLSPKRQMSWLLKRWRQI